MRRNLIFIPKNVEQITIKKHRPISLLNSTLKLADTCIVQRLVLGLQNANVLPSSMSAYRKGHSIADANLSLQTYIENCQHTGKQMVILNFDIYFVCEVSKCTRNWLHFFESSVLYPGYSLISCREIADHKPLVMRGISGKFHTALHHRISHKHE